MEGQNSTGEPVKKGQTKKAKKTKKKAKQTKKAKKTKKKTKQTKKAKKTKKKTKQTEETQKEDISHLTKPPKDLIMCLSHTLENSGRKQVFDLKNKPYNQVIEGISSENGRDSTLFKVSSKLSGVYNVTKTLYEAKFEFCGYTSLKDKVAQEEKGITKKSQLRNSESSVNYIKENSEKIFKTNEFKEHLEDLKNLLDAASNCLREDCKDSCLLKNTIDKAKNLANSCIKIDSKDLDRLIKDLELMGDACSELSFLSVHTDHTEYLSNVVVVIPQDINRKIKSILLEIFVLILPISLFESKTKKIADPNSNTEEGRAAGRGAIEKIYNLLFRESEDMNLSKYLLYRIHKKYSNSSEDGFEFKDCKLFIIDFLKSILNESKNFCSSKVKDFLKVKDLLKEFPRYKTAPENILGKEEKYFSEAQEIVISHFKKGFKDFTGNPLTNDLSGLEVTFYLSGLEFTFYSIFFLLDIPKEKYADAYKEITFEKKQEICNRLKEIGL